MSFNNSDFSLRITYLGAEQRVLRPDGNVDREMITVETQPCDHKWYRLVVRGGMVVDDVLYGYGLTEVGPTSGGTSKYYANGQDLEFIDIHPGSSNVVKSATAYTESRDVTAEGCTVVIVHRYAKIIGPDDLNMIPMYVLADGETKHVDAKDGQVFAVFEIE